MKERSTIYTPKHFSAHDFDDVLRFMKEYSFGTVVSCKENRVSNISKVPLIVKNINDQLQIEGHLARHNHHWESLRENSIVTVIFDGPHDYISPQNYEQKAMSVPTWNFASVVASGEIEIKDDPQWALSSALELASLYEKNQDWLQTVDKDFLNLLSKEIVGFTIKVEKIESKFKMSQNRSSTEINSIIKSLQQTNPSLAQFMRRSMI